MKQSLKFFLKKFFNENLKEALNKFPSESYSWSYSLEILKAEFQKTFQNNPCHFERILGKKYLKKTIQKFLKEFEFLIIIRINLLKLIREKKPRKGFSKTPWKKPIKKPSGHVHEMFSRGKKNCKKKFLK